MDEESSVDATNTRATGNSKRTGGQRKKPGKLLAAAAAVASSSGVDDSGYESRSSAEAESTECCSPLLVLDTFNCVNVASFELAHTTDEVYRSSDVEAGKAASSISRDTSSRGTINELHRYKPSKSTKNEDKSTIASINQSNGRDERTLCEAIQHQQHSHIPRTACPEDCSKGSGSGSVCQHTTNQHTLQQGVLEAINESAANPPANSSQSNNTQGQSAQGQSAQGQSAQGQSAQGQSAQGQSAQGQSAQGQSAQGQSAQGPAGCDAIHPSQSVPSSSHIFLVVSPPPAALSPPPFASLGMNLSFCGAGFLGMYHLGTAHTLATHGRGVLLNTQHYLGASAGSLVAAVLAIRGPDLNIIKESVDFTLELAESVRRRPLGLLTPGLSLLEPLGEFLERTVPEDAPATATGRLHVSMTTLPRQRNVLVSHFSSKQHLIKCLLASSYVPFATGTRPVRIDGQLYMDGGMTDNLPLPPGGGRTICVSPFAGRQEISPGGAVEGQRGKGMYVKIHSQTFAVSRGNVVRGLHAFFPPPRPVLLGYFRQGQADTAAFLHAQGWWQQGDGDQHTA